MSVHPFVAGVPSEKGELLLSTGIVPKGSKGRVGAVLKECSAP